MNTKEHLKPDAWNELIGIKNEIIEEMSKCKNETAKLRQLNDWLRRELDLESRHQGILAEADRLINERKGRDGQGGQHGDDKELGNSREPAQLNTRGGPNLRRTGGKERARECRAAYIEREKRRGKNLVKIRSAYYRNDAGSVVGITFSSEKKDKKGAWFLNLQDGQFQEAVLLCETSSDSVQAVHLPKHFLEKIGRDLSKDDKGQVVKFNVLRQNGRFSLQIPEPVGPVDVTEFVDGEPFICPHSSNI